MALWCSAAAARLSHKQSQNLEKLIISSFIYLVSTLIGPGGFDVVILVFIMSNKKHIE